jgi:cyclopropane-fatty-acyl-phospholipid synthase
MKFVSLGTLVRSAIKTARSIEYGTLRLTTPKGTQVTFTGKQQGPDAQITLRDWKVVRRLLSRGDIALGEDYVDGTWDSENIENLMTFFLLNLEHFEKYVHGNAFSRIVFSTYNRFIKRNSKSGSRRNIKIHYDVGNEFYKLWLDDSMTYSSALFGSEPHTLEEAQHAKYQRILQRLGGNVSSLLEIGCGWGGFAEEAAGKIDNLKCLTLSSAQLEYAKKRLNNRADILLQDYRNMRSSFDAIVSIEMFEAVGERYWPEYFRVLARNLKRNGKAVVQTITIRDELFADYRKRSDFIRHYVFPGGMLPSLQRFRAEAAKAGLKCNDVFTFGQDYAQTLRVWNMRFEACLDDVRRLGYDESFIRNWRFYLNYCAAAFAVGRTNVAQIELVHV